MTKGPEVDCRLPRERSAGRKRVPKKIIEGIEFAGVSIAAGDTVRQIVRPGDCKVLDFVSSKPIEE